MQISRRDLFRSAAAVGGAAALGGFGGLSAEAVTGTGALARSTRTTVLHRSRPAANGWRTVVARPGETHVVRTKLGIGAKPGRARRRETLIAFAHLSDVHVCDHQSPMRLEIGDPRVSSSAYRPQEILTGQIADAMVREINAVRTGPVTGAPLALAIQTGDNSDSSQYNEVRWNIDVLDGGEVRVDSGDPTRYEGVMDGDPDFYDPYFWHPEGTPAGLVDDVPRSQHGFPTIPGLLDAARAPFEAVGLDIPWYSAMGNHDGLVQGNWPATTGTYAATALGSTKKTTKGDRTVTPDPNRRLLSKAEWVEEHFKTTGLPVGHGFDETNREQGTAYYHFDRGRIRFVVLDSVNPNGFEDGSIDPDQFAWLQQVLAASSRKLVVVASHHTIETMTNHVVTDLDPRPRVLGDKIRAELLKHDNVILWVNGHTHRNQIWAHPRSGKVKEHDGSGFWEVNTASHVDWPQQSRLIEITDNLDGTISIFTTMLDHSGPAEFDGDLGDPQQLAALGRLLAANDWQEQDNHRRGRRNARNVELLVKAPRFLRR